MKLARLEEIYKKPLVRAESAHKILPTEFILKQKLIFYPTTPDNLRFDFVEIGPGRGDFLLHLAETHTDKKILGIEIGKMCFQKLCARINKKNLTNVTLIHGDARVPFATLLSPESLTHCFVLFPDPWPHNKQRHKRLLQMGFLTQLALSLKLGGTFTLATDVKDYALWVLENAQKISCWENSFGKELMKNDIEGIIPTFYKNKWQAMGRKFCYLNFTRTQRHP